VVNGIPVGASRQWERQVRILLRLCGKQRNSSTDSVNIGRDARDDLSSTITSRIGFEKARLEHCIKIYDRELARKDAIEKKSQLYLSLLAILITGVFLKIDLIVSLRKAVPGRSICSVCLPTLDVSFVVTGVLLLISLISILFIVRAKQFQKESPANAVHDLFSSDSVYLSLRDVSVDTEHGEAGFYELVARSYAIAFDQTSRVNNRNGKYLQLCSICVFLTSLGLTVLVGALVYSSTLQPGGEHGNPRQARQESREQGPQQQQK